MKCALFTIYSLLFTLPGFASAPVNCGHRFAQADGRALADDAQLAKAEAALDHDMAAPSQALAHLEIKADGIDPIEFLGDGMSGSVFRVKYQGKDYALKLFRRITFDKGELPGILIQKHLGDLGLAPKVKGVLNEAQSAQLFRQHTDKLLADGNLETAEETCYGLLMDLAEGTAYKRLDSKTVKVTAEEEVRLMKEADRMVSALHQLKIKPYDLDLMVTEDKHLILIDLTSYTRGESIITPMQRQFRQMTSGLLDTPAGAGGSPGLNPGE